MHTIRVIEFRESRGWTQAQAAAWYGVSVRQWRRYETGETPAQQPLLNRIAAAKSVGRLRDRTLARHGTSRR